MVNENDLRNINLNDFNDIFNTPGILEFVQLKYGMSPTLRCLNIITFTYLLITTDEIQYGISNKEVRMCTFFGFLLTINKIEI